MFYFVNSFRNASFKLNYFLAIVLCNLSAQVLIDSRPPPPQSEAIVLTNKVSVEELQSLYLHRARTHFEKIELELERATTWNFYRASSISFMHSLIREFTAVRLKLGEKDETQSANDKKSSWLYMALIEKQRAAEMEGSEGLEELPESTLATSLCEFMFNLEIKQDRNRRNFLASTFDEFLEEISACESIQMFIEVLERNTADWAQSNYFIGCSEGHDNFASTNGGQHVHMFHLRFPELFEKKPFYKDGRYFSSMISVCEDANVELSTLIKTTTELILERRKEVLEWKESKEPITEFVALVSQTMLQ